MSRFNISWDNVPIADAVMALAEVTAVAGAILAATRPTVKRWWRGIWERPRGYVVALSKRLSEDQLAALKDRCMVQLYASRIVLIAAPGLSEREARRLLRGNLVGIAQSHHNSRGGAHGSG